ncbi:MAG: SPOR domain-containing protein [Gammaproteobacteria bacterium]
MRRRLELARHARGAWVLCVCAALTVPSLAAWGQTAPSADAGNKAVIAEFSTREQAERRAASLRRQGRPAQVVKVVKPVSLLSVQLGYYKRLVAAESARKSLRRNGIETASVQRTTAGYAVVVGQYLSASAAAREGRRLRALGHRNVRTERFVQMRDSYQVVEISLPESAGSAAGAAPVQGAAANASRKVTYHFTSAKQADAKAAELKREGYKVSRRSRAEILHLKNLQLRVFQQWSDARRIAMRLERRGIPARVINDPIERGYAVSAGAFSSEKDLRRRYEAIRKLGFRSVSVVPVQVSLIRYTVEGTAPAGSVTAKAPSAAAGGEPQVMVFGGTPESFPGYEPGTAGAGEQKFRIGIDQVRLEAGALTRSSQPVDGSDYLFGSFSARWRPSERWEYRLAGRVDGYVQTGTPDYSKAKLDYGDSYVRYRGENVRVTVGTQTVIWGRVDEIPPEDRLSVQDATRFTLDPLQQRRRSTPMLRFERFHGQYKLDAIWVPDFRPAQLPDMRSIWSPVDKTNGRLLGVESSPALAALVENGGFADDKHGQGGFGLRLSHAGRDFDYGLTVQHARRSMPYYQLNEAARTTLLATGNPAAALAAANGPTFVGRHPMSWVLGGDFGFQAHGATWRFEAAYLSDMPATTQDLRMITLKGVDWVGGVEFYPGDANARVNLQLAGHHLFNAPAVFDQTDTYLLNGSMEDVFSYNRWRAKLRFSVGLNKRDVYLNPELAYIGWEPNEFYLGMHYFDGADGTLGGFHKDHSIVVLGWRAHY